MALFATLLGGLFGGGLDLATLLGAAGTGIEAVGTAGAGIEGFGAGAADLSAIAGESAGGTALGTGATLGGFGAGTGAEVAGGDILSALGGGAGTATGAATTDASTLLGLGQTGSEFGINVTGAPLANISTVPGATSLDITGAGVQPVFGTTPAATGGVSAPAFSAPAGVTGVTDPTGGGALSFTGTGGTPANPLSTVSPAGDTAQQIIQQSGGAVSAPGASPAPSGGFDLSSFIKNAQPYASIAAPVVAGGGLAYNIFQGNKQLASQEAATQQAAQQNAAAQTLESYLATGTLPPGLQAGVTQAVEAQKAAIRQKYANMGLSTDPTQNSALEQELAAADQQGQTLTAQIGQELYQMGASGMQISSSDLNALMNLEQQQQTQLGNSIANFASALGGAFKTTTGGKGTTITVS